MFLIPRTPFKKTITLFTTWLHPITMCSFVQTADSSFVNEISVCWFSLWFGATHHHQHQQHRLYLPFTSAITPLICRKRDSTMGRYLPESWQENTPWDPSNKEDILRASWWASGLMYLHNYSPITLRHIQPLDVCLVLLIVYCTLCIREKEGRGSTW